MIKKIKRSDYLKRYETMTDGECKDYQKRVGEWLAGKGNTLLEATDRPMAKSQNYMTIAPRWSTEFHTAFYEGVLLLSALVGVADTWLPTQIYAKSVHRAVRKICYELSLVSDNKIAPQQAKKLQQRTQQPANAARTPAGSAPTETAPSGTMAAEGTPAMKQAGGAAVKNAPAGTMPTEATNMRNQTSGLTPVRPKHIDQYVHLLPKATQEKAAQIRGLLRDLDDAREKTRLLMEAPQASQSDRAAWASRATKIDAQVGAIYKELDAEWAKLVEQGRVVVDDLGNAHVVDMDHEPLTIDHSPLTVDHEPSNSDHSQEDELSTGQKARRRDLRKFLTDTRRGNGKTREEHLKKWNEAFKAYLALEPIEKAMKDEKILAAMEHYGLVLTDAAKATMKGEG